MVLVSFSFNLFYLFGMEQLGGSFWGRGCFFLILLLLFIYNIYKTNTYTTYNTIIILTYICIYITLLMLTLFT